MEDSQRMMFFFSESKVLQMQSEANKLFAQKRHNSKAIRKLHRSVSGCFESSQSGSFAPEKLTKSSLEVFKTRIFKKVRLLSNGVRQELLWWVNWLWFHNGRDILPAIERPQFFWDASKEGWRPICAPWK